MKRNLWPTCDSVKDYFPLPKEIFSLSLSAAEIARAAAANPAVLLLDGITANLDAETEQRVLAALRRACEGRTVLSVSHRIYENLGGRTIEIGSQRNAALSHV